MAFKLGDVIVDRLQFGYGAKANGTPLYALTQLTEANIDITADSTDINDKDGNLVYRRCRDCNRRQRYCYADDSACKGR